MILQKESKTVPGTYEAVVEPALTAYRQETEPERIVRLNRVLGYALAVADSCRYDDLLKKVISLHDHKGYLTVTWRQEPHKLDRLCFSLAWDSPIGDGCENVDHEVVE